MWWGHALFTPWCDGDIVRVEASGLLSQYAAGSTSTTSGRRDRARRQGGESCYHPHVWEICFVYSARSTSGSISLSLVLKSLQIPCWSTLLTMVMICFSPEALLPGPFPSAQKGLHTNTSRRRLYIHCQGFGPVIIKISCHISSINLLWILAPTQNSIGWYECLYWRWVEWREGIIDVLEISIKLPFIYQSGLALAILGSCMIPWIFHQPG